MNLREEIPAMFQSYIELSKTLGASPVLYVITDTTDLTSVAFSDLVFVLSESRVMRSHRTDGQSVRLMLVGAGNLFELAAKAMGQLQYGSQWMRLFPTLGDALAAARAELGEPAPAGN